MKRILILSALAASAAIASPAMARGDGWAGGPKPPKPPSSTTSTSGGSTSVPEPGMIGLMGAGVIGLALSRRRRKSRD